MPSKDILQTLTTGDSPPLVVPVGTMSRVPSVHDDSPSRSGVGIGPAFAGLLPPPQPPPPGTRQVSFAHVPCRPDPPPKATPLVSYNIPLDKARPTPVDKGDSFFTLGLLTDPSILVRLASPTTPFEFPFQVAEETYCDFNVSGGIPGGNLRDSVTHVVGLPRVCGLSLDSDLAVRITQAITPSDAWDNPLLMDGGANICLTGVLDLLVDVVTIAPLPSQWLQSQVTSRWMTAAPRRVSFR